MTRLRFATCFVFCFLFCRSLALGQELLRGDTQDDVQVVPERKSLTTADFSRVNSIVRGFVSKHGSDQVLLVVDIDNTLLAMNQPLGSDQWFNWQDGLLRSSPDSPDLVASNFEGLLEVQGTLFALSGMHAPEPDLPNLIREIQDWGVTTIVLTSRGPGFRDAAERELRRNGYRFDESRLHIREKRGLFIPFDPDQPSKHGLTAAIVAILNDRLAAVTYSNGIYMTAGQHKGYMLRTLLARAVDDKPTPNVARDFSAIVFVDDHVKHTERMQEAFENDASIDLATVRYSREDGNVSNFKQSSKRHVVDDWDRLRGFLTGVLVK